MSLRWIERDGKMVLQELVPAEKEIIQGVVYAGCKYEDVPTHQEPRHCEHGNCWKCREDAAMMWLIIVILIPFILLGVWFFAIYGATKGWWRFDI